MLFYPYWCLEKGYARFSGARDQTTEWAVRAKGWMRVMRCDAWCSMVLYTFATLAFYLLGAGALGVVGLAADSEPARNRRIKIFSGLLPPVCVLLYVLFPHPTKLVLLSGAMQAIMLPMLASAALYFRYRRNDPRLTPSRLWDIFL